MLVTVEGNDEEILTLLLKDFWKFLVEDCAEMGTPQLSITFFLNQSKPEFPTAVSAMQTQSAISYDFGETRYSDYYGEALSIIDFSTNRASIYSDNSDKLREVIYLMILSRVGKALDLIGFHKLHAFAVACEDAVLVCMMPTKGGKSTLLAEMLKNEKVKMVSDDIPIIDSCGRVYPFLLKLGLDKIPDELKINNPEQNIYTMKRTLHGVKQLICLRGLENKIVSGSSRYSKIILIEGFRFHSENYKLQEVSTLKIFKGLFKHGIIGVGAPIVIEYFWEFGLKDFWVKSKIFIKRLRAFMMLAFRADKYHLYSGKNYQLTAQVLCKLLIENRRRWKKF